MFMSRRFEVLGLTGLMLGEHMANRDYSTWSLGMAVVGATEDPQDLKVQILQVCSPSCEP